MRYSWTVSQSIIMWLLLLFAVAEFFYPPGMMFYDVLVKGPPFTNEVKRTDEAKSPIMTEERVKGYAVVIKLGHQWRGFLNSERLENLSFQLGNDKRDEKPKEWWRLRYGVDWERLMLECLAALVVARMLWEVVSRKESPPPSM